MITTIQNKPYQKLGELGKHYPSMRLGQLLVMLGAFGEYIQISDERLRDAVESRLKRGVFPRPDPALPAENEFSAELLSEFERMGKEKSWKGIADTLARLAASCGKSEYDVEDCELLEAIRARNQGGAKCLS